MKKILIIVLAVIIGISLLVVVRDFAIKSVVSIAATQITGSKVDIGWFSLCLITQSARVSNFKIYNPDGFSKRALIDLPKIVVKFDVPALIKGKLHLRLVDVDLREIGQENNASKA